MNYEWLNRLAIARAWMFAAALTVAGLVWLTR